VGNASGRLVLARGRASHEGEDAGPVAAPDSTRLSRSTGPGGSGEGDRVGPSSITIHPLLTVAQVARVLNVGERTVWRMTSRAKGGNGEFPKPVRIGGHAVRWRWQDLLKYLEEMAGK
jgi:predicted DNA-binding transcriptional regulator AlpA